MEGLSGFGFRVLGFATFVRFEGLELEDLRFRSVSRRGRVLGMTP